MRKVSNRLAGIDNDGETKKYAIEISEDEDLDDFPLNDFNRQTNEQARQHHCEANLVEN